MAEIDVKPSAWERTPPNVLAIQMTPKTSRKPPTTAKSFFMDVFSSFIVHYWQSITPELS